jgi:hypothetical protein
MPLDAPQIEADLRSTFPDRPWTMTFAGQDVDGTKVNVEATPSYEEDGKAEGLEWAFQAVLSDFVSEPKAENVITDKTSGIEYRIVSVNKDDYDVGVLLRLGDKYRAG